MGNFQIKKWQIFVMAAVLILAAVVLVLILTKDNGTYYLFKNDIIDQSKYVVLKNGKWESEDGSKGTYKKDGNALYFYLPSFSDSIVAFSGELSDGELTISIFGTENLYCKKGKTPKSFIEKCETDGAYRGRTDLTEIVIPDGVKEIGDYTFSGCTDLKSVTIPASVKCIGMGAFEGCTSLQKIQYDNRNVFTAIKNAFTGRGLFDNSLTISESAFKGCYNLKTLYIPHYVNSIKEGAFADCSNLMSVVVEKGNSDYRCAGNCLIGSATVYSDTQRRYVPSQTVILAWGDGVIPNDGSVTAIGKDAFSGLKNLSDLTIPDGVIAIGDRAFHDCTARPHERDDSGQCHYRREWSIPRMYRP